MILSPSEREKVKLLIERAIPKLKGDPQSLIVKEELEGIIIKIDNEEDPLHLPVRISMTDIVEVNDILVDLENAVTRYVKFTDVNDLNSLEEIKKEISIKLMYLSTYKDKFLYEIEYVEDVFKKEMFSKLTSEISLRDGVSYTQAEKKVNADERYMALRSEIRDLKENMMSIKTKYDFYSKMIQVVVQSISVAGKEQHASKLNS